MKLKTKKHVQQDVRHENDLSADEIRALEEDGRRAERKRMMQRAFLDDDPLMERVLYELLCEEYETFK